MKIKDLNSNISINTGYSFRKRIEHQKTGDTLVIQLKDIDYSSFTHGRRLTSIEGKEIKNKYLLEHNDILFSAKGHNNYAVLYEHLGDRTIASSVFFILRCIGDLVFPPYLAWYMNQPEAQNHFKSKMEGTYTQNISKTALLNLPIELPSYEKQEKVVQIADLIQKETRLISEISAKRQQLISTKLNTFIKS